MKILHTSDWHLGRSLYGKKRYDEFSSFLDWLVEIIISRQIDLLLICGDVFDTTTPSNRAQQLYYNFIQRVTDTTCRHIIIIGGNHDSPSLLAAPKSLLEQFRVFVVGSSTDDPGEEVFVLKDSRGNDELIVCAVPYLRDRDIRLSRAGESTEDKTANMTGGIAEHYREVTEIARQLQTDSATSPPIVATGHLFAAGGKTVEGDGVRDLYVGSLSHIHNSIFSEHIAYLALGHLHSSQVVGGNPLHRYCGSPLAMSFAEGGRDKCVLIAEVSPDQVQAEEVAVPRFQQLASIRGDRQSITDQINELRSSGDSIWLEVLFAGDEPATTLQADLLELIQGSSLEILRVVDTRLNINVSTGSDSAISLEAMGEEDVFRKCLLLRDVPEHKHDELLTLFRHTMLAVDDEDPHEN